MARKSVEIALPSAYVLNCIDEVERSVLGRDNRVPIHDALNGLDQAVITSMGWKEDLGLVVENGKLCVTFESSGSSNPNPVAIPTNVQSSLAKILTDIYGTEVRADIVVSGQWGVENLRTLAQWWRSLGLTVRDGKLCVTNRADDTQVPSYVPTALNAILTDTKGTTLREDITKVLRWGLTGNASVVFKEMVNTGLSVINGKLNISWRPEEE